MPLPQVGELLRGHGVGAVQLRCAADEPVHPGLSRAERQVVRHQLGDSGLALLGLAPYVTLADGAAGLAAHLDLAFDPGAPALRLMPGGSGAAVAYLTRAAATLAAAAAQARGSGYGCWSRHTTSSGAAPT
ncbi:hypothetical protein [Actinoplanes aureus]|uniref:Uncharacterized protein n=1 Tax=Actinoplanes aureus TaxID=2792083 RepID=A0A931FYD2_9ACTN|nr:hypothetical protein [Actinoplanes aureus]MBG0563652.1 hypothetical protein [Actinoplanes aureus]